MKTRVWQCMPMTLVLIVMSCFPYPVLYGQAEPDDLPRVLDRRLQITEFAREPDIVTPTGLAVDSLGRVFVIESHTHFRPDDYEGPPGDRVIILEDTDGDGRADARQVFHEGLKYGMDLAFHPDGTLYLATRWAIYRLPDRDGDDRADRRERIVTLNTPGDYPHNGLSGLAFDPTGNLRFGLGENLGEPYTLVGKDGRSFHGGGEGGSTYECRSDGTQLRKVSTGWWNPFGIAVDSYGRVFGTDNDPGASPPCRLIEISEGADFGYEYRYGRTGLNPLITWEGDIPGTLPMRSGTGEAPCGIVAYESIGFPQVYYGNLLVPCWADHHIERYEVAASPLSGQSVVTRHQWIQGPNDFRPVDIAVAPDGSVYVSDWVLASYALHGRGRVWRIAAKRPPQVGEAGIQSHSRSVREETARRWAASADGRQRLLEVLGSSAPAAAKATVIWVLSDTSDEPLRRSFEKALNEIAHHSKSLALRRLAARTLGDRWNPSQLWQLPLPLLAEWVRSHGDVLTAAQADRLLRSADPFLLHVTVNALSDAPVGRRLAGDLRRDHLWALLLAARRGWRLAPDERNRWIRYGLASSDWRARFLAVKWIADEKCHELAGDVAELRTKPDLDYRTFRATLICAQRLAGREVTDWPSAVEISAVLSEPLSPAARRWAIRVALRRRVALDLSDLESRVRNGSDAIEFAWAIVHHPSAERVDVLARFADDESLPPAVRCVAIVGLADFAEGQVERLVRLAASRDREVAIEALRALPGVELDERSKRQLRGLNQQDAQLKPYVDRALTGSAVAKPAADDLGAWLEILRSKPGDGQRGERLFFHPKFATCGKCHSVNGRGTDVGPSMSAMSRRFDALGEEGLDWLLRSVLRPSTEMAPQFTPWQILTRDGRIVTGLPRRKGGSAEAYLGVDGKEFTLRKSEIERHQESPVSLMPEGLLDPLTMDEIRDLFAYLMHYAR